MDQGRRGGRRELFVDDFLIGSLDGLRRTWHQPLDREIAIKHEAPREGTGSGFHCVVEDNGRYRLYDRGGPLTLEGNAARFDNAVICMATSHDGVVWKRPDLGIVAFKGSKANNIILDAGSLPDASRPIDPSHLGGVVVDEWPGIGPGERYKAVLGVQGEDALLLLEQEKGDILLFLVARGLRRSSMDEKAECPLFPGGGE